MKKKYFSLALTAATMLSSTAISGYNCEDTCVDGWEDEGSFFCDETGWACTDTDTGVVFTSKVETACKDVSGTKVCIAGSKNGVSSKTEFNSDGSVTTTQYHSNGQVSLVTTQQGSLSYVELDTWNADSVYYEIEGEVTQSSSQYYDSNGVLQGYSETKYENGEKTEETIVNQSDTSMIIGYHDKYGAEYFPANQEVETKYENGEILQKTTTTHNSDGSYNVVDIVCEENHAGCFHESHGDFYLEGSGLRTTKNYDSDGVIQSEILETSDSHKTVSTYENGILVSMKEYDGGCDHAFLPCERLTTENWKRTILSEYELDAQGNVVAKWKNVPIGENHHECWEECEDYDDDDGCIGPYEQCEDWEEITGYYKEKYSADGETLLAKYSSGGDLIESYEVAENKPVRQVKRIYTVEEAEKVSKPTGNTFRLRYK
ncbi:MAG TPA: hypothetical protein DIC64_04980 [Alphaproteobacteria bacterium]|nr:hypothetical protein [Alphaproteobacteria bacterium]